MSFGNLDKVLNNIKLLGFNPQNILDIGAHHGNWSLYVNNIFPLANYELIEPIEYKELERLKPLPNMNYWNILSDTEKKSDGIRKRIREIQYIKRIENFFEDCEVIKNTLTLDSLFKERSLI